MIDRIGDVVANVLCLAFALFMIVVMVGGTYALLAVLTQADGSGGCN